MTELLKLRAEDEEDLRVLSAHMQDALIPIADMAYLRGEKQFVMVANRFRWEAGAVDTVAIEEDASDRGGSETGEAAVFERTNSAFTVHGVIQAQLRGFDPQDSERLLNLLAIRPGDGGILLEFSEGASVRLRVERIECYLRDIDEPWPTLRRPSHATIEDEDVRGTE